MRWPWRKKPRLAGCVEVDVETIGNRTFSSCGCGQILADRPLTPDEMLDLVAQHIVKVHL